MECNLQAVLEGILFIVGDEGVQLDRLVEVLELDGDVIQSTLDQMISAYVQDDTRGVEIVCYGGIYKMVSKAFVECPITDIGMVINRHIFLILINKVISFSQK